MTYEKRIVKHSPEIFVRESEAMGVNFEIVNGHVRVSIAGVWLPSDAPLTVYANRDEVVAVLRESASS